MLRTWEYKFWVTNTKIEINDHGKKRRHQPPSEQVTSKGKKIRLSTIFQSNPSKRHSELFKIIKKTSSKGFQIHQVYFQVKRTQTSNNMQEV